MTIRTTSKLGGEFILELARGNISNMSSVVIAGNNMDIGQTFEDVWDAGGTLVYPTVAESWELVSTDASDSAAGTGLRTVIVNSLDDDYKQQSQIVTLNGTTPVALTGTHFRPRDVVGITAGSNETNAGDVTLRVSGGGLTRGMIKSGNGSSHSSHFTTPAGETAFSLSFNVFIPKNQDVKTKLTIKPPGTDSAKFNLGPISLYQSSIDLPVFAPIPVPEKTDIKFEAKSLNESAELTLFQELILVKDQT